MMVTTSQVPLADSSLPDISCSPARSLWPDLVEASPKTGRDCLSFPCNPSHWTPATARVVPPGFAAPLSWLCPGPRPPPPHPTRQPDNPTLCGEGGRLCCATAGRGVRPPCRSPRALSASFLSADCRALFLSFLLPLHSFSPLLPCACHHKPTTKQKPHSPTVCFCYNTCCCLPSEQATQSPPLPVSSATDGHPAIPSLLLSFLLLPLTAETLIIHWLALHPASILFHSPRRLSATFCSVIPPNPSKHSDASSRRYSDASAWELTTRRVFSSRPSLLFPSPLLPLSKENLNIHWLTLPPASILFHSPWRPSATCCCEISPSHPNHSADALTREHGDASVWEPTIRPDRPLLPSPFLSLLLLSLTAETLKIHWLTLSPASILFHSPCRLSAICCILTPPNPLNYGQCE